MKLKKMLAGFMTLCIAVTAMPATVLAEETGDAPEVKDVLDETAEEQEKQTEETVTEAAVAKIGDVTYTTLAAAVEDAKSGDEIVLLESVKGSGIVIDKNITIDFDKNTYDIVGPAVGSAGTTTLGFQILSGNTVTLKDGTITESAPEQNENGATDAAVKMLVQNYSNLTLEDMVLDGSKLGGTGRYTLSNNCGTVELTGKTKIIADDNKGIALDACEYASYAVPTVTIGKDCVVDGKLEVTGDANLVIEGGSFTDLANAVKYAEGGATIALLESVKGSGIVIDKNITIDFDKNTYDIIGPAVGSAGTTTLGFQILSGNTVTLKDGTITESAPEQNENGATDAAVKMLVQNYSNLTLDNMVLDGSKLGGTGRYVLSNNSGNITITNGTEIIADTANSGIAFDVCKYASYNVPTVTFENGSAKGAFEVSEGLAGNLKIYAGYFTQDPTAYKAEGKVVESVDKDGYTYKVGEPTPEPTPTPSTGGGSKSKPKYTASVDKNDVDNGDVKLSSTRAKAGSKVTVTVTPDAGYELKKLVILDKAGNKVDVTDNGDGTFTFKMPKGGVEVVPTFVEAEEDADVSEEGADSADKEETVLVLTIDQRVYQQDGNYAVNDVAPIISGERTFLPIRLIAEALGATVSWENETQAVTIVDGDTTIVIYMGQPFATVNGTPIQLDAPAFITNGRTYLPVRFIAENLGATVNWDAEAKTVTIIG
ncbi:stalk domain-containing protein [Anaerotignum sp.]